MTLRCFIALDIDPALRRACDDARTRLTASDERLAGEKWVAPENLHVTLSFVGDVTMGRLEELIAGLTPVLDRVAPISLSQPVLTARPSSGCASMIWVALHDPTGAFTTIATALHEGVRVFHSINESGAAGKGSPRRHRSLSPHLTLCRFRRKRGLDPAALSQTQQVFRGLTNPMSYPRATLYSSRLAPQGPTYSELFVWHMRGE